MNKKIMTSVLCLILSTGSVFSANNERVKNDPKPRFEDEFFIDAPRPMFMMTEPPFMMENMNQGMEQRLMFAGDKGMNKGPKFSEKQEVKVKELDKEFRKDMKKLRDSQEELREEYREKFEEILTDEQFRKIENLRKDLRKGMKKLIDKQHDLLEEHRRDFESILTEDQKKNMDISKKLNKQPEPKAMGKKFGNGPKPELKLDKGPKDM